MPIRVQTAPGEQDIGRADAGRLPKTLRDIICCLGISADQIFYPDLENDTDAQQVMRLYENCSERDKQLVKALLSAIYKHK